MQFVGPLYCSSSDCVDEVSHHDDVCVFFITALKCDKNQFECFDNHIVIKCIPLDWKCDNAKDCADNSDEMDCNLPKGKSVGYFTDELVLVGRQGDFMVTALDSGSRGSGLSPGRENLFCVLDKTLNAHSASLHPGAKVGTDEFNTGVTLR